MARQAGGKAYRLSALTAPTARAVPADAADSVLSHQLLLRAGYLRQSSSGIYSLLPLGMRVQANIERIIDEEMEGIGAQKVSLPSVLSSAAWKRTGRWESTGAELFRLKDRKEAEMCLAPTHEEEITQLVRDITHSYRQLPLRFYQIGRKYRDEARPRSGLLRGREFMMKDLYSFDGTIEEAAGTYEAVREAYHRVFQRLSVPFLMAEADSGNIGGSMSHEYHYLSDIGEDSLWACTGEGGCGKYAGNEEVLSPKALEGGGSDCAPGCPYCGTALVKERAIEVGHTFLLGTRYSEPLEARYQPADPSSPTLPIQMGCYGIGVSRLVAAIAQCTGTEKGGLMWPEAVSPHRATIIPLTEIDDATLHTLASGLSGEIGDVLLDDRQGLGPGARLRDADLYGNPWSIIVGRAWKKEGHLEVVHRPSGGRQVGPPEEIAKIMSALSQ